MLFQSGADTAAAGPGGVEISPTLHFVAEEPEVPGAECCSFVCPITATGNIKGILYIYIYYILIYVYIYIVWYFNGI